MIRTWLLAATMVLTLGACGGGDGIPATIGGVCDDFGTAFCGRLGECDDTVDVAACESQFYAACCDDDGTCDLETDPDGTSDDEYDECLADVDDLACEQAENGELPASCDGV